MAHRSATDGPAGGSRPSGQAGDNSVQFSRQPQPAERDLSAYDRYLGRLLFLFTGGIDFTSDPAEVYALQRRATYTRLAISGLIILAASLLPVFYDVLPAVFGYSALSLLSVAVLLLGFRSRWVLVVMGVIDIGLITYAVHLTGSMTSVVVVLYPLHVIMGTLFAGLLTGTIFAVFASVAYTGLIIAESAGWLPYSPYFGHEYPGFEWHGIPTYPVVIVILANVFNFTSVLMAGLVTYALEKRRREAQAALRARTELAAICSHDLKNLLAAIMGHAELAQVRSDLGDAAKVKESLQQIQRSGDRMMELVRDLLDLSRLEAGQIALSRSRFDLAVTVRNVAMSQQANARLKNVELKAVVSGNECWMDGDQSKMIQVLTNLVQNAVRHTPEGGTVRVTLEPQSGGTARISVTDTGPGIDPEEASGLFDTGSLTRRVSAGGRGSLSTGLGLNIVRRLTDLHGGRVWIESADTGGACFTVEVPVGEPA